MSVVPLDEVFAALGDPTRLAIYDRLTDEPNGITATALDGAFPMSRQAIVKHLQVLVQAGLATGERSGREVRYRAVGDSAAPASAWLAERSARWSTRTDRLAARLQTSR